MSDYLSKILDDGKNLKKEVSDSYVDYINELKSESADGWPESPLSETFVKEFDQILKDPNVEQYSEINFFWLSQIDKLMTISGLHCEMEENTNGDDREEILEEIFLFWNDTEFSKSFFELQEEESDLYKVSLTLMTLLENQCLAYYYLNIGEMDKTFKQPVIFFKVPEKGDRFGYLLTGENGCISGLKESESVLVKEVNFDSKKVVLEEGNQLKEYPIQAEMPFETMGKLRIANYSDFSGEELSKLKNAYSFIETNFPKLKEILDEFSGTIIPIKEEGIVSYSMQSLPTYSSINAVERDEIDAIDDLLHENGHHILNRYLNNFELINEDDEKIFFSPWRVALRPIRGIYHAVFTFHWAFILFREISKSILEGKDLNLSEAQQQKCFSRFLEEREMILFCKEDLEKAYELEKVTPEGDEVIKEVYKDISSSDSLADKVLAALKNSESFNQLKNDLQEARKVYGSKD